MKKIVYLSGTLRLGGSQQQVVDTAASLNRMLFGPKVYAVFGGGPLYAYAVEHGVDVAVFNNLATSEFGNFPVPFKHFRQLYALWRYLQREKPDIVHCYLYKPAIYGGIAVQLLKKRPIFITSRRSLGDFKDATLFFQTVENVVNRFTDCVVVNSQGVKRDVLQRESYVSDRIAVIYNGVDIRKYRPAENIERQALRDKKQKLGVPETAPVVGMIANLFPYKGYQEFIQAAAIVLRDFPETRFLCVGEDCGMQAQLETCCTELGIESSVIFTGQIQEISGILPLIDIQVSASHEEGFSNAILEGMACGIPLIATDVGGTSEAVVDQETGFVIPSKNSERLAQAIKRLLSAPELATKLGWNGRKRIEKLFSMDTMMQTLEMLYLDLLQQQQERC